MVVFLEVTAFVFSCAVIVNHFEIYQNWEAANFANSIDMLWLSMKVSLLLFVAFPLIPMLATLVEALLNGDSKYTTPITYYAVYEVIGEVILKSLLVALVLLFISSILTIPFIFFGDFNTIIELKTLFLSISASSVLIISFMSQAVIVYISCRGAYENIQETARNNKQ
jgi:hypothetical protein